MPLVWTSQPMCAWKKPARRAQAPVAARVRRVGVALAVGQRVVLAVVGHPLRHRALQRHRAQDRERARTDGRGLRTPCARRAGGSPTVMPRPQTTYSTTSRITSTGRTATPQRRPIAAAPPSGGPATADEGDDPARHAVRAARSRPAAGGPSVTCQSPSGAVVGRPSRPLVRRTSQPYTDEVPATAIPSAT